MNRTNTTIILASFAFLILGFLAGRYIKAGRTIAAKTPEWCNSSHTIPYIPADQCGGGSSCARAQYDFGHITDWPALCQSFQ